ncbi:hypothetical protein RGU12_19700 [Fredinandcohnia sp. QZ13]|uniref:hypothetical protein n=1 Tax=Fredinandcohnia sp. QZ13 TaxID=3073144 RepID=UPI0028532AFE|nr:hypothetical protein [Fredinandcohnia sp. QZ13]MDR4889721.1 hypothetical protein [Fredinandcohnia sp. QZ13]
MWKKFLELFIKKAWPVIRKLLVKYGKEILEFVFEKVTELFKNWIIGMGKEKKAKAEESYEKAKAATNPEEKKKFEFEYEFYKKEAESYKEKIKVMEEELEKLKETLREDINKKTTDLKAEDLFSTNSKDSYNPFVLKDTNNILKLEDKNDN